MRSPQRPWALLRALLAAVAAVVIMWPATAASAASMPAAGNGAGASTPLMITVVGVPRHVSPGGVRCGNALRPSLAVGACVAAEDVGDSCEVPSAGGQSFTASTKVLLASGAAVPVSSLKVGEQVLATNTRTGKTQAEAVTAVLVRHDTDLYDLKIRDRGKTAVIATTSSHLFWVPGMGGHGGRWVKAGALRYGTHLRTPGGDTATVIGGWVPSQRDGWMWDLTVPGNDDHDFYIDTAAVPVLVHNECPTAQGAAQQYASELHDSATGRPPTAAAAAVDRTTGEIFLGHSGELTDVPEELADLLPDPSNEPWPSYNCAEAAACSKAIAAGSNLEDLEVATVRTATGEDFPPCRNCSVWLPGGDG